MIHSHVSRGKTHKGDYKRAFKYLSCLPLEVLKMKNGKWFFEILRGWKRGDDSEDTIRFGELHTSPLHY
eukprot:scaffold1943_cov85-Skeletonema_dohrnii-CCMP3373.AAC.4